MCDPEFLSDPHGAARSVANKLESPSNGAVMRVAALGIAHFHDLNEVATNAVRICKATHCDPRWVGFKDCLKKSFTVNGLNPGISIVYCDCLSNHNNSFFFFSQNYPHPYNHTRQTRKCFRQSELLLTMKSKITQLYMLKKLLPDRFSHLVTIQPILSQHKDPSSIKSWSVGTDHYWLGFLQDYKILCLINKWFCFELLDALQAVLLYALSSHWCCRYLISV